MIVLFHGFSRFEHWVEAKQPEAMNLSLIRNLVFIYKAELEGGDPMICTAPMKTAENQVIPVGLYNLPKSFRSNLATN